MNYNIKKSVSALIFLCLIWNLNAQEQIEILNHNKILEYQEFSHLTDIKLLLNQNPEIPVCPWDYDRMAAIQDTFYRLDSTIYYKYPSENDSVFYTKEITQYLTDGSYKGNIRYRFDDINNLWIYEQKTTYYFDTAGVDYLYINYQWNKTDQNWRPVSRVDIELNEYGAVLLRHYQNWDTLNSVWISNYKRFSDYDENRNLIVEGSIYWSKEENTWISGSKYEYEYNDIRQKIMESYFHYDPFYPKWIGYSKSTMEYDGNLLISEIHYNWVDWEDIWIPYRKDEYQYDDLNRQTILIISIYDEYSQVWNYLTKTENTYNLSDQIILSDQYQWTADTWALEKQDSTVFIESEEKEFIFLLTRSSASLPWDSVKRTEVYFDEVTGNTETNIFEYTGYDWLLTLKTITRQDDNGSSYYEGYTWDISLQQLRGIYIMELLYNDRGSFSGFIFYDWSLELNDWIGSAKELVCYYDFGLANYGTIYKWDTNTADWKTNYKYFRYYSMIINTDTDPLTFQSDEISIYPNPASDFLNISLAGKPHGIYSYHIYNLTGKLIKTGELNEQSGMINVSDLQNGLYILKVDANPSYTQKIVIRK